ncbi:hypothetical protein ACE193_17630 [Bernardetia sp. OM2101]|uniref:hypothetical protein n=1 Tax=Bernardetia sp. OM2101 TaxID=3344876 RepID=UPI0035D0825C
MKNISIRKAIGLCYLGLSFLSVFSAFSLSKAIETFASSPFMPLFVVLVICSFLCFLSFILWIITDLLITRYLGYLVSFCFLVMIFFGIFFNNKFGYGFEDLKIIPFLLSIIAFSSLFSYSKIAFVDKKQKHEEIETLDSDMLFESAGKNKKLFYFWTINKIYCITLATFSLPFLLMAMYSSNFSTTISYWEVPSLFANVFTVLFWLKPKWARMIFIVLSSIALVLGIILILAFTFGYAALRTEGLLAVLGICMLILGLILILLSKEAQAELKAFENKKD